MLRALMQQQDIQRKLAAALLAPHDEHLTRQTLQSLQADADGLDTFFRSITLPFLYNEQCPTDAKHVAQRVFDIPEIFKGILVELECLDLLESILVNRQFRDAVLSSKRLQRRLSLLPEPDAPFSTTKFIRCLPGYCFFTTSETWSGYNPFISSPLILGLECDEDGLSVQIEPKARPLGSRCRNIYFCQPPVEEIYVYTSCCADVDLYDVLEEFLPDGSLSLIKNEGGLTIGDLWDEAEKLFQEHGNCANADWDELDDGGRVQMKVYFKAIVKLPPDDPILKRWKNAAERAKQQGRVSKARKRKMVAFTAAKQAGMHKLCAH
ncbi:hypothetical protein LTR36_002726 [Oleoguttula mirabilis]|uniref:F-box domain-containing protein n=1 Tax=Oleoguttula mirabilis TaxID=1507867 RepID=A0AAV9JL94_9PEZI|nr:hypothetical protein LTR36_002726 [Oleoguttula mirabilis]